MISDRKAIMCAEIIANYCKEQKSCQNCIFRLYGCSHWECSINGFDLRDVVSNVEAKKKNKGYI